MGCQQLQQQLPPAARPLCPRRRRGQSWGPLLGLVCHPPHPPALPSCALLQCAPCMAHHSVRHSNSQSCTTIHGSSITELLLFAMPAYPCRADAAAFYGILMGIHLDDHLVCLRKTYMPRITYSRLTMKEKPAGMWMQLRRGPQTYKGHCTCQCHAGMFWWVRSMHGRGLPATDTISQTHHLCLRPWSKPGTLTLTLSALHRRAT